MRLLSMMKSSLSGSRAARAAASRAIMRLSTGAGFACCVLELGAQDRGEVADVLGDQEVVLHEALDVLHGRDARYSRAAPRSRAGCRTTAAPRRAR